MLFTQAAACPRITSYNVCYTKLLRLDLGFMEYMQATQNAFTLTNFWIGLTHATVFGFLISLCGCWQGMACGRSASAVGKATTAAVVTGIVSIVVATAIITVICDFMGI